MKATGTITAHLNPVFAASGSGTVVATLSWTSEGAQEVEVRVDAPDGPLLSRTAGSGAAATGRWLRDGTVFYLQDVSGGAPLTAEHTLATVAVTASRQFDRSGPKALILLYHRVADIQPDPWSQCVTPRHFAEHLEVLSAHWQVLRLGELVRALEDESIPDRSVVITFDDGYADILHGVKPLLERWRTPATVFVASGPVGKPREFWWDQLERSLLRDGTPQADLYRSLYRLLRPLPDAERRQVLDQLREWEGIEPEVRASHRPLTVEELTELARGELVEIGAHTITHPALAELPESQQRAEIQGGKARLEEMLGRRVRHFACPYGSFSEATPEIVRRAGFESACCRLAMVVDKYAFPFLLPRLGVQNWDGEEFARRLSEWHGSEVWGTFETGTGAESGAEAGLRPAELPAEALLRNPERQLRLAEEVRRQTELGLRAFQAQFDYTLKAYRSQRAWQVMLLLRKCHSVLAQRRDPVSSFLKWLAQVPWKSARALAPSARSLGSYELTFPSLESYVPPELVRPFQPAPVDAGVGAPVQTIPRQTKYDLVFLPPFEFDFRFQRPQQLAIQFARSGHRVFWVSP
ncbi:MAG: polysaccharide deacetylase family protein, partial [Bryobacteraceae bacterium]